MLLITTRTGLVFLELCLLRSVFMFADFSVVLEP